MLQQSQMHGYQRHCVQHILDNPYCGLFLGLGLGKTISTLTAIDQLLHDRMERGKVLVIAPLVVADHTWQEEVNTWEHVSHLRIVKILGSEKERVQALKKNGDIYTINRENISWLVAYLKGSWPFRIVVGDELSSFKNPASGRFKALKVVRPLFDRFIGLTATPAPNSLEELWSQVYLMDRGERLGKNITQYRERYFVRKESGFGYRVRTSDDPILGSDIYEREIYDRVSDICISMKAEDYLTMPERIDVDEVIDMPDRVFQQYKEFERKAVMQLKDTRIDAFNAGVLAGKLLQFSNGAVYDSEKEYHEVHDAKLNALAERIELNNGNPVLCFYNFQSDVDRMLKKLKHLKPFVMPKGRPDIIDKWNQGEIPFAIAHPDRFGYGVNMQRGGTDAFWFGCPWSSQSYRQANGRIYRQGQMGTVRVRRFLMRGTMEDRVVKTLANKIDSENQLLDALKAFVEGYN